MEQQNHYKFLPVSRVVFKPKNLIDYGKGVNLPQEKEIPRGLSTLSFNSSLSFGKHKGKIIGRIINLDKSYLIWIYYNIPHISFTDRVLSKIGICDSKIEKPGVNIDLGKKVISGHEAIERAIKRNKRQ